MRNCERKGNKQREAERIPLIQQGMNGLHRRLLNQHTHTPLPPLQPSYPSTPTFAASLSSHRLSPSFLFVVLSLISFRGIRQQQHPLHKPRGRTFSHKSHSVAQFRRMRFYKVVLIGLIKLFFFWKNTCVRDLNHRVQLQMGKISRPLVFFSDQTVHAVKITNLDLRVQFS